MVRMCEATYAVDTLSHVLHGFRLFLAGPFLDVALSIFSFFLSLLSLHSFLFGERVSDLGIGRQLRLGQIALDIIKGCF
jgi:hypothetical protein